MNLIKLSLFSLFLISFSVLCQQIDFNNYIPLKSKGIITADFTTDSYKKIKDDINSNIHDLKKSEEKIFLEKIHYGVDDILHSGLVVYGDEVSLYIQKVASNILKNDKELFQKLRFYTIKSNETNAFSTDQGIIFVTTGLISQLANEAQLGFVLAHEISHFMEKHVVESFEHQIENKNNTIRELSIYSKEKELEADKFGLKLYYDAGYSKDDLFNAFDLLMYSYLPFEEETFPKNYYNKNDFYIPLSFFTDSTFTIKAIDDYDDSESSHPNIKSRKEKIELETQNFKNWKSSSFILNKEEFDKVRNICRFENVRIDIINTNYADALYSIFILEKTFPNSLYLKKMKAQSWLGFVQNKNHGSFNATIKRSNDLEGESAILHTFIKKLKKEAINSIALREIFNIYFDNKNDKQIKTIIEYLIEELVNNKSFKLDSYSSMNYEKAKTTFAAKSKNETIVEKQDDKKSKYDKIKNKKNIDNQDSFDSTKFYLYGMKDIFEDDFFKKTYTQIIDNNDKKDKQKEDYNKLSKRDKRKFDKTSLENESKLGINEFIIVEPIVHSFKNEKFDQIQSEKLKKDFSKVMEDVSAASNTKTYSIDRENLIKGTNVYNERNILFTFMSQIGGEDNFNIFPVDFDELNEIYTNYGTSKIVFPFAEHNHIKTINFGVIYLMVACYPMLPIYLPMALLKANYTEIGILIFDIEKGKIDLGESYTFIGKPKKYHLGAHLYKIFTQIQSKPIQQ